jgi:predicted DNA-binding transcriptional regulator YafY
MAEENYQKIKLLKIMEILRQETDEEHPMTKVELASRLVAMNISCSPRSLIRDIKLLNEQGYEIMERLMGHEKGYFVCDRSFSVPELKILIDAVQAAIFVTDKKTGELIDKIAALGGSHRAGILKGNIVKFNTRKHRNETVYYTVGFIEDAIQKNKKIIFKYFDLDENGQKVYRRDGHHYVVEPVALVFNEDNYYLIVYSEKHDNTANYRVDRIDSVEVLDDPISEKARSLRRKVARYTEEAFKMFNGQPETVTLRFSDKLIGPVLDKFGEVTKMTRVDDHTIEATVQVRIAPTFWGWLFQFGKQMKIVAPDEIKDQYKQQLRELNDMEEDT